MKIQIDLDGLYDYLKFSPLAHLESEEEWKGKAMKFPRPYVSLPFGEAELPSPLKSLGIILRGNGINYWANACVVTGSQINSERISKTLLDTIPSGLSWKSVRRNQIDAYIYNHGESCPSFAFSSVKPGSSNPPIFTMFMGTNGSRTRRLGLETEFIEEMNSFEGLISYFVSACLALRRKTKTLARKIECPSVLEFTCLEATYNF